MRILNVVCVKTKMYFIKSTIMLHAYPRGLCQPLASLGQVLIIWNGSLLTPGLDPFILKDEYALVL